MKYLYINEKTLFELIDSFENFEANHFKYFVYTNLLSYLDKIYKVVIKMNEEKIIEIEKRFI